VVQEEHALRSEAHLNGVAVLLRSGGQKFQRILPKGKEGGEGENRSCALYFWASGHAVQEMDELKSQWKNDGSRLDSRRNGLIEWR
jgi:hypothetical protein